MCAQCMATAAVAGAAATGARAWLAARRPEWLTRRRLRAATGAILAGGVVAASVQVSGAGAEDAKPLEPSGAVPAPSHSQ